MIKFSQLIEQLTEKCTQNLVEKLIPYSILINEN